MHIIEYICENRHVSLVSAHGNELNRICIEKRAAAGNYFEM